MTTSQKILLLLGNCIVQGLTDNKVIIAAIEFEITSAGEVKYGLVISSPKTIEARQE